MIRTPTIHLGGTSREQLNADYRAAYDAVSEALRVVQEVWPHDRDYFMQGTEAMREAHSQHCARVKALRAIKDQYERLVLATDA